MQLDTAENGPGEDARPYLRVITPEKPKVQTKNASQCGEDPRQHAENYKIEKEQNRNGPKGGTGAPK